MSLYRSIRINFPEWQQDQSLLPEGLNTEKSDGSAFLRSFVWKGENIRRARLCEFEVPGKFTAETLVIYPCLETITPIFGTEYITIGNKKFFGAIDFHPFSQEQIYVESYIDKYLHDFPQRSTEQSKFYDLSTYFSSRFWIKKSDIDFRDEYHDQVDKYMARYHVALMDAKLDSNSESFHRAYDKHMAENDPAHGILKSYFSKEFADFYVEKFLFDLSKP